MHFYITVICCLNAFIRKCTFKINSNPLAANADVPSAIVIAIVRRNFLIFFILLSPFMKNFLFITKSGFFSPDKLSRLMYPKETDKILIIFSIDLFLKSLNLWYCTVLYCTVQHTYIVFKSHINFPSLFLFIF